MALNRITDAHPTAPNRDSEDRCAANTDPPAVRCSWCGGRTRWESGGYWLTCPTSGHPSSHDPRIHGWFWHLRVLLGI